MVDNYGQFIDHYDKITQKYKEPKCVEYEIKSDEYFNSVSEFMIYLENNDCIDIKKKHRFKKRMEKNNKIKKEIEDYIQTKYLPDFIIKNAIYQTRQLKRDYKKLEDSDENKLYTKNKYTDKYGDEYNKIYELAILRDKNFYDFIINNKDKVFEILDDVELNDIDSKKMKKQLANKTYYEKKKILNPSEDKILLNDEEKRLRRIEANKKYYENKKKKKEGEGNP